MIGVSLTESEKDLIEGVIFRREALFCPVLTPEGDYFISTEESLTEVEGLDWLRDLPIREYEPIIEEV